MSEQGHVHVYPMSDRERIAVLEANERNMGRELKAIRENLTAINKTLSEMSGGKKAVMGLFGLIGGAIGVLGTMFAMYWAGK